MNKAKLIEWLLAEIEILELIEKQVTHHLGNVKKLTEMLKDAK